jgi:phosphatidylethanolamine/phosphatidyl-N-methylethanolamine N-methyltransferase
MDAERMTFPDSSFDAVLALYVASVVPDPARFAAELRRVCRPGGTIVIVNHFSSDNRVMHTIERWLAPLAGRIGFHADFPLPDFLASSGLSVREQRPSNLFGYWTLLRCVNDKPHAII